MKMWQLSCFRQESQTWSLIDSEIRVERALNHVKRIRSARAVLDLDPMIFRLLNTTTRQTIIL